MKRLALAVLLALPLPAVAAPPPPAAAPARIPTVTVTLADRAFHPRVIGLNKDQLTRIVLVNRDVSGHNFDTKAFFSHAEIRDEGAGAQAVHEGLVSVPSQSTVSFLVTPRYRGHFDLNSSVALDVASGMQAQILVY